MRLSPNDVDIIETHLKGIEDAASGITDSTEVIRGILSDPDTPQPPPHVKPWDLSLDDTRFSYASGGYCGFSSSSNYAAVRGRDDFLWRIIDRDGVRSLVLNQEDYRWASTLHQHFMWSARNDEFYLVRRPVDGSQHVERYRVHSVANIERVDRMLLPQKPDGRQVQYSSSICNSSRFVWLKGWDQAEDATYVCWIDGQQHVPWGWWLSDATPAGGTKKWQNVLVRDGLGLGGALVHLGGGYPIEWHSDALGSQLHPVHSDVRITHLCYDGGLMLFGHTPWDGWELWDHSDPTDPVKQTEIPNDRFSRVIAAPYANPNHADIRNGKAVFSVENHETKEYNVLVWEIADDKLWLLAGGIRPQLTQTEKGLKLLFSDHVLPSIAPNGRAAMWHDGNRTRIKEILL